MSVQVRTILAVQGVPHIGWADFTEVLLAVDALLPAVTRRRPSVTRAQRVTDIAHGHPVRVPRGPASNPTRRHLAFLMRHPESPASYAPGLPPVMDAHLRSARIDEEKAGRALMGTQENEQTAVTGRRKLLGAAVLGALHLRAEHQAHDRSEHCLDEREAGQRALRCQGIRICLCR